MTPSDTPDRLFDAFPPVTDAEWLAAIEADLKGKRFEDVLVWEPLEGFPVQPFYRATPEGAQAAIPPPTAGWTIRQDLVAADPSAAAAQAEHALNQGAEAIGLLVRTDPGDGPGLPLSDAAGARALIETVLRQGAPLHLDVLGQPDVALNHWVDAAESAGRAEADLKGSLNSAPLARAARLGFLASPASFDALARTLETAHDLSGIRCLGIDLEPYHEAGASATQELACLLASVQTYVSELTDRGCTPDQLARHLHVRVPVGTSYFMEVAKLRTLRHLLAQMLAAYDEDLTDVPILVQATTSRRSMTLYDPYVNMLRATTQAASAILGGCDTLTVRPYNEVHGAPDVFGLRIARNTQLILRDEAYLNKVADPAAGSYYIEHLTDDLGEHAWGLFQEIERRGGFPAVLREGWIQAQIAETRQTRAQQIASRKRVLVGTNQYPDPDETLGDVPPERPMATPIDTDAVSIEPLPPVREGAAFETLRRRTEAFAEAQGHTPVVYLLLFGHRAMRSARATFARNLFGCAGFAIQEGLGHDEIEAAAEALQDVRADVVVLCSANDAYRSAALHLAPVLRRHLPDAVVTVAGHPSNDLDALREAGVDDFIHLRRNVLETLLDYQRRLGILKAAT